MQELINTVNKIEKIILDALSSSDREILALYVSQQVKLSTNEKVKDGLNKILKQIKVGWTNYDESPQALSVKYFEKNIFTLTPFQNRIAYHFETWQKIDNIFQDEIVRIVPKDKYILFLVIHTRNGFCDILWKGINFLGRPNDDSYYENHAREYELIQKTHSEFVKRDCQLLRELFEEL